MLIFCVLLLLAWAFFAKQIFSILASEFQLAGKKLSSLEILMFLIPYVALTLAAWTVSKDKSYSLPRFELIGILFTLFLGITSGSWKSWLVSTLLEVGRGKAGNSASAHVLGLIWVLSSFFLIQQGVEQLEIVKQMMVESWNDVPKSEQFLYYGFAVIGVIVATVYSIQRKTRSRSSNDQSDDLCAYFHLGNLLDDCNRFLLFGKDWNIPMTERLKSRRFINPLP